MQIKLSKLAIFAGFDNCFMVFSFHCLTYSWLLGLQKGCFDAAPAVCGLQSAVI
jgi:hypothetical protein